MQYQMRNLDYICVLRCDNNYFGHKQSILNLGLGFSFNLHKVFKIVDEMRLHNLLDLLWTHVWHQMIYQFVIAEIDQMKSHVTNILFPNAKFLPTKP